MTVSERITAATVTAELDVLDQEERVLAGGTVVTIGFTNAAVKTLGPRELEEVAAYLFALLERAPLKASPAYAPHRIVLGALATELRGFAHAAGEPVGGLADLRAAGSQAEERRVRARLADEALAFDRHVDDVLLEHAARQAHDHPDDPYLPGVVISDTDLRERGIPVEPEEPEEEPTDPPAAATTPETDDAARWL